MNKSQPAVDGYFMGIVPPDNPPHALASSHKRGPARHQGPLINPAKFARFVYHQLGVHFPGEIASPKLQIT
jgi:hypothetical protein